MKWCSEMIVLFFKAMLAVCQAAALLMILGGVCYFMQHCFMFGYTAAKEVITW